VTGFVRGDRILAHGDRRTYAGTVLDVQADGYAVVQLDCDRQPTRIYADSLTACHHGSASGSTSPTGRSGQSPSMRCASVHS
jgi:hypothetical protein